MRSTRGAVVLVGLLQPVPELVPLRGRGAAVDPVEVNHLRAPGGGALAAAGTVMLEVDPVAGIGAVLELHAAGSEVGVVGDGSTPDAFKDGGQVLVRYLAWVLQESAGDEAAVPFQDDVPALLVDDCPGLGGVQSVLGDASGQADDLGSELL